MLLILGLDGATLDLIGPWAREGLLPNLARLMANGAWGRLSVATPPATFPSWTSFMTGVNPGRHGIFDFSRRDPGSYRIRFVNASFRKAPSIWHLLSSAGRRVAVLGLPATYPPEPVNGCMISGFDTPVTTRADRSFVYPPEWAAEVARLGGFPFADFQEFSVGPQWYAHALRRLKAGIERKTELARRLLAREDWDCFMLLIGESDTVAHHFWAFHDRRSPRFDPALHGSLGDPIRDIYVAIDHSIGELVSLVPEAHVLVASDHGFGGAGDTAVYLNRWLDQEGFLTWQTGSRRGAKLAGALRQAAVRIVPEGWQRATFRLAGGRLAAALESTVRFGGIDWSGTQAFSEELNYSPAIWLNVEGRDPQGCVRPGEYDRVCRQVAERLLGWRDPLNCTSVVRNVWRRDELYDGPCVDIAPDLILELEEPGGYSYVCLPSQGTGGPVIERLSGAALAGGKLRGMSGSHRPDGVFILNGPGVAPGELRGADITDLAPTILALCDGPGLVESDGGVLPCVEGAAGAPRSEPYVPPIEASYDPREEGCIRQRLEQLGYLE